MIKKKNLFQINIFGFLNLHLAIFLYATDLHSTFLKCIFSLSKSASWETSVLVFCFMVDFFFFLPRSSSFKLLSPWHNLRSFLLSRSRACGSQLVGISQSVLGSRLVGTMRAKKETFLVRHPWVRTRHTISILHVGVCVCSGW